MRQHQLSMCPTLYILFAIAAVNGSLVTARVRADESSPLATRAQTGIVIGGKVGAGLGKPWSEFGATPAFELELGYALPPLHRSIEVFVSGQYIQPGIDGVTTQADPRLGGSGVVNYQIVQQGFALSLGGLYRIDVGSRLLMPYAGLGARLYMLRTNAKGDVTGEALGDNHETQSRAGLLLLGGGELFLGPGAVLAELSFGWASIDRYVLRKTNLGALSLSIGYRLMF